MVAMKVRTVLLWIGGGAVLFALAMRWVGAPHWGWVLSVSASLWVFLFLLPAMGARGRERHDAAEKRVTWGD